MSVWAIAIVLLIEVVAITFAMFTLSTTKVPYVPEALNTVLNSILFGGLGGCTYCLRGIYLNSCVRKTWDISWLPWYFIRPVVSMILGGVSYLFVKSGLLLFGASQQPDASQLGIWAVAFLAGLNVDKFVSKIESIGQTVWGLTPSRQSSPDLNASKGEKRMSDFFEIDFLDVEAKKSGDAIAMRYLIKGITTIHVTDGGYQDTGLKLVNHIKDYYDKPRQINHVVATHPDGDHAGGLRTVLESFEIGKLWMLRPWIYADELLPRFSRFTNPQNLAAKLKEIYPNIAALEEIALRLGISIGEPFQGQQIGAFTVMAPSRASYLNLIVQSERTPEAVSEQAQALNRLAAIFTEAARRTMSFIRALWGEESFSSEETSAENEMSVVQYALLNEQKILLTADTGREGLKEIVRYAPYIGLQLPGIDRFQVPHHGSRRNVSTDILDCLLGPRLPQKPQAGQETFSAIISSAEADPDHPRKAVIRAMIHRGAKVISTEGRSICTFSTNAPTRQGWSPVDQMPYPEEQEE